MKERVEKKLGCTIEEFFARRSALCEKYKDFEIELPLDEGFLSLDDEETDFMMEYTEKMHNVA